jgi:nicotinamide riboside kinase
LNIALLGAECTGKSTLAQALAAHMGASSAPAPDSLGPAQALCVPELLRDWCTKAGRPPHIHEQMGIAHAHARALDAARANLGPNGVLVADTTPLMTAIYSLHYFQDASLLPFGLAQQRRFSHTLVTALDLPWQADGFLRDGPAAAQTVDRLLRDTLNQAGVPYQVIHGRGGTRLTQALAVLHHSTAAPACAAHGTPWHTCAQCGDAGAERQLFRQLLNRPTGPSP